MRRQGADGAAAAAVGFTGLIAATPLVNNNRWITSQRASSSPGGDGGARALGSRRIAAYESISLGTLVPTQAAAEIDAAVTRRHAAKARVDAAAAMTLRAFVARRLARLTAAGAAATGEGGVVSSDGAGVAQLAARIEALEDLQVATRQSDDLKPAPPPMAALEYLEHVKIATKFSQEQFELKLAELQATSKTPFNLPPAGSTIPLNDAALLSRRPRRREVCRV